MNFSKIMMLAGMAMVSFPTVKAFEIINLTEENHDEALKNSDKPAVIKAYADWCGACRNSAPHFVEAATKLGHLYNFFQINTETSPELTKRYGVQYLPTLIFIKNHKEVGKKAGLNSTAEFEADLHQYLD